MVYIILIGGPIWFFIWLIRRIVKAFQESRTACRKEINQYNKSSPVNCGGGLLVMR